MQKTGVLILWLVTLLLACVAAHEERQAAQSVWVEVDSTVSDIVKDRLIGHLRSTGANVTVFNTPIGTSWKQLPSGSVVVAIGNSSVVDDALALLSTSRRDLTTASSTDDSFFVATSTSSGGTLNDESHYRGR
jgi:hypothetical protein